MYVYILADYYKYDRSCTTVIISYSIYIIGIINIII